jgi:AraC-like DNA-binding protein
MPQDRILLQHTAALKVERVVLHEQSPQWSPHYEVTSRRMVLPASGATEFRAAGRSVLLDSLTALCLPTGQPYQMKPCTDGVARASIVVSAQPGRSESLPPSSDAWRLTPRAVFRLRCHWRALALGREDENPTQALLGDLLQSAAHAAWSGEGRRAVAVQRAQNFMVARTAAMDAAPWTLHHLADAACCSPFHLARLFRRHTGLSLHQYRQQLRLAAALQRLEEGERQLAALAHEAGFSSQSHMGAVFRHELGVTPAQARQALAA